MARAAAMTCSLHCASHPTAQAVYIPLRSFDSLSFLKSLINLSALPKSPRRSEVAPKSSNPTLQTATMDRTRSSLSNIIPRSMLGLNNLIILSSSAIITGILSWFLHRYRYRGTHLVYNEVIVRSPRFLLPSHSWSYVLTREKCRLS